MLATYEFVDSNLQFIFYLKFSMRKDVVDYSPWFPTGNAKAIIDFNRTYTTVHFRKEKKMSECEFPNSVSIGSKLDQENHENSPKIARGATSPMLTGAGRSWCSCLPPPVCLSVPLLAMGRESYMWPCWKNSRKMQLSHPWLDPYSLVCCLSWVSKSFLAIL